MKSNADNQVIEDFGYEWSRFDQSKLTDTDLKEMFDGYFEEFPWHKLDDDAIGFDLGCGSGRWAKLVAPRVGKLHLIEPSVEALAVAKRNLRNLTNCEFHLAGVEEIPLADNSCDFGYCLGVLHHIPNSEAGLCAAVAKLKKGAPFLLYLYYRFENRPAWYAKIWSASNLLRQFISRQPHSIRLFFSQILAAIVYFPLARTARVLEMMGINIKNFPLAYYRRRSFYVMQTDSLDRFGTKLEKRFSKTEIRQIMEQAGLENITFGKTSFWTAVGYKK